MANQIKKKFIGNDQVDGDKVLLLFGQDVRRLDDQGTEYNGFENVEQSIIDEENRALAAESDLQSQITTEKGRVDAILSGADANLDTFAEVVALINTIDTENDTAFAGYVLSNDARVDTLEADVTSLDTNLNTEIQNRVDGDNFLNDRVSDLVNGTGLFYDLVAQQISYSPDGVNYTSGAVSLQDADFKLDAAIKGVQDSLDVLEGEYDAYVISNDAALAQEVSDRTALEGEYDAYVISNDAAVAAIDTRVTANEGDIAQLQSDLSGLGAVSWQTEKFVIDATILSNGYIDLASTPELGSVIAFVDRLAIFEGAAEDFTVSSARITFINQLVSPGNQALQVGDEIRVKYRA